MKKINYLLITLAVVLIIVGFALMSGGGSDDPQQFNEAIFSTRRIVVAPIVATLGFVLMGFGIMYQPREQK